MFQSKSKPSEKSKNVALELLSFSGGRSLISESVYNFYKKHIFEAKDPRIVYRSSS